MALLRLFCDCDMIPPKHEATIRLANDGFQEFVSEKLIRRCAL
jgi:hypothetical protein